jgi:hypothetical protein
MIRGTGFGKDELFLADRYKGGQKKGNNMSSRKEIFNGLFR